ncbi:unnamed protein product [Caenorhabditis sp. 36 PRJEB53466]|nr:unnamed protein product [Caenorhabditis sp. 36 PRJEB53466]
MKGVDGRKTKNIQDEDVDAMIEDIVRKYLSKPGIKIHELRLINVFICSLLFSQLKVNRFMAYVKGTAVYPIGYFRCLNTTSITYFSVFDFSQARDVIADIRCLNLNRIEYFAYEPNNPNLLINFSCEQWKVTEEFEKGSTPLILEACQKILKDQPARGSYYTAFCSDEDDHEMKKLLKMIDEKIPGGQWKWKYGLKLLCYEMEHSEMLVLVQPPVTMKIFPTLSTFVIKKGAADEDVDAMMEDIVRKYLSKPGIEIHELQLINVFICPLLFSQLKVNRFMASLRTAERYPIGYLRCLNTTSITHFSVYDFSQSRRVIRDAKCLNLNKISYYAYYPQNPRLLLDFSSKQWRVTEEFEKGSTPLILEACQKILKDQPAIGCIYIAFCSDEDDHEMKNLLKMIDEKIPGGQWKWEYGVKVLCYEMEHSEITVLVQPPVTMCQFPVITASVAKKGSANDNIIIIQRFCRLRWQIASFLRPTFISIRNAVRKVIPGFEGSAFDWILVNLPDEDVDAMMEDIVRKYLSKPGIKIHELRLINVFICPLLFSQLKVNRFMAYVKGTAVYPIGYFRCLNTTSITYFSVLDFSQARDVIADIRCLNLNRIEYFAYEPNNPNLLINFSCEQWKVTEEFEKGSTPLILEACQKILKDQPAIGSYYTASCSDEDDHEMKKLLKMIDEKIPGGQWKWKYGFKLLCYEMEHSEMLVLVQPPVTMKTFPTLSTLVIKKGTANDNITIIQRCFRLRWQIASFLRPTFISIRNAVRKVFPGFEGFAFDCILFYLPGAGNADDARQRQEEEQ